MGKPRSIVFFDVDGTLTFFDPENQSDKVTEPALSPSVPEAFKRLQVNGHLAVICTGRPRVILPPKIVALGPDAFVINGGGSLLVGDELVFESIIENEIAAELAKRCEEMSSRLMFESNERSAELAPADVNVPYVPGIEIVHTAADLGIGSRYEYSKVCGFLSEYERMDYDGFISDNFTLCKTGKGRAEITPKGVDKGFGVRKALEYFGFEGTANSYALGDSGNDLAMLAAVETPVAMGNSMPEVFEVAAYVTADVMDDGVYKALEHFELI